MTMKTLNAMDGLQNAVQLKYEDANMKSSILTANDVIKLVICFAIFVSASIARSEGGQDGGGGNVCAIDGKAVVLDVVGVRSQFEEQTKYLDSKIPRNRALGKYGFERMTDLKWIFGREFEALYAGLASAGGKDEAAILKSAFDGLTLFIVDRKSQGPIGADFSKTPGCSAANTRAVIYYHPAHGIFIDINRWNSLDSYSRFVLILHEALRNIQQRFGAESSDGKLQEATALLVGGSFSEAVGHEALSGNNFYSADAKQIKELMCNHTPALVEKSGALLRAHHNFCSRTRLIAEEKQSLNILLDAANPSLLREATSNSEANDFLWYRQSIGSLIWKLATSSRDPGLNQRLVVLNNGTMNQLSKARLHEALRSLEKNN